jgi:hypothetical protein
MSNLNNNVVSIPFQCLSSSSPVTNNVLNKSAGVAYHSQGSSYLILEFAEEINIRNIVIRNSGTPFLTILTGKLHHLLSIKANLTNSSVVHTILSSLSTIIPEVQLLSADQYKARDNNKINKVKTFRNFNQFLSKQNESCRLLVLLCRDFYDCPGPIGLQWIEIFACREADNTNSIQQPDKVHSSDFTFSQLS